MDPNFTLFPHYLIWNFLFPVAILFQLSSFVALKCSVLFDMQEDD